MSEQNEVASTSLLAFRTSAIGTTCIVFAETRGKARAATVRAGTDAGYRFGMTDVRCRRAPAFDGLTEVDRKPIKPNWCYSEDHIFDNDNGQAARL